MEENNQEGGFRNEDREMHKTTCSECGKDCEVPFKPTEGKPVYCRDCYRKRRRF
jgi:CxxC-x17-CxxC domain-containing protein